MATRIQRWLAASACLIVIGGALAEKSESTWLTDFAKAKEIAQDTGQPILANFSGSDWCRFCIMLEDNVLEKPAFKKYAEENMVLFLADFPRRTEQPEDVAAQNKKLAAEYGIRGFPTVLLLTPDGEVIAQTGYRRVGPEGYVEHLEALVAPWKQTQNAGEEGQQATVQQ